ncbi:hypothetical protein Cgig2_029043 [Carnegiea gigantea]|uniref:Receptor-like serine/threonine-protein kinase n=1 Tax=Carnegiea gigantea TaxID=171969 RepID=A0A9Q1QEV1_9CARY|nr:hypothetical protein Cgig2_029043 [Carnegiea gigantea]
MSFLFPYLLCAFLPPPPLLTSAQSSNNASPSKEFSFGFQEIEPGSFLLATWFDAIPEKTITWSANRDHLAPRGSKVELTREKGLVLSDPSGQQIWQAKLRGNGGQLGYGAMLDAGNFVLTTQAGSVLWQSFDEPTDTILPTQILNLGAQLIAQFSQKNYSSGRFMMQLGTDGNLGLYTTNYPLFDAANTAYVSSSIQGSGYQVVFNKTGHVYLVAKNGSILSQLSSDVVPKQGFYQRVILEYDGVLRHYIYRRSSPSSSRSTGWSTNLFIPENVCTADLQLTGGGVCGYNSYCSIGNDKGPYCSCPPGYSLLDPNDEMGGCDQNLPSRSCEQQKNGFDLRVFQNVDWPLDDYNHFENVTQDWCREDCCEDCNCAVAVFKEGNCWKKKMPLSGGRNDTSLEQTTFIKVAINVPRRASVSDARKGEAESTESCLKFNLSTISSATNDFSTSNKLGQGGFGAVYKDRLPNGRHVAVKRLIARSVRREEEFKNEVRLVARLHHKNLIKLIGFCVGGTERILVYELGINGSLDRFLFDEFMNPKISDFGTARLFVEDQETASKIVGTYGYMAPEYAKHGKISTKIDVFSFGVLLLEITCGKRINLSKEPGHIDHLLSEIPLYNYLQILKDKKKTVLMNGFTKTKDFHFIIASGKIMDITQCVHIGLLCVQENAEYRPSMHSVMLMLEGSSQSLPLLLKPAYFMDTRDYQASSFPVMELDQTESQLNLSNPGSLRKTHLLSSIYEISITQPFPEPR